MGTLEEAIPGFTFYSLDQCTHQQLLSHSKHPVNIYHRTETNQIFVVKQVPFTQNYLRIYKILKDQYTLNIVRVYGLSMRSYVEKNVKQQKRISEKIFLQENQFSSHEVSNNNKDLLIWMPKCEKSLVQYVEQRRKKLLPFSAYEIKNFMLNLLTTLQVLQRRGICHRDIKPQNILVNKNRYFLCDFDEAILTKIGNQQKQPQQIMKQLEYTTILYSSPKFLKSLKQKKNSQRYFDPYKMDVYSFGLTLLYVCSLGKFSIQQRHLYLYSSQSQAHLQFIEEQRKKYVKKVPQLNIYNKVLKLMLQQDQYKRDDFITLNQKIIYILGVQNQSQSSLTTKSGTTVRQKKQKKQKQRKKHGKGFKCGNLQKSQRFLIQIFFLALMIYSFLLIF